VPVNSTHPDYDANAIDWLRARDVLAGEDAIKAAGEKYLSRLDSQTEEEFLAYRKRASFFNATARSSEGFVGLIFRRPPFVKIPEARAGLASSSGVGKALAIFVNDADMLGTTLAGYAKSVVTEVVGVGRAGSLVDWENDVEKRAYVSLYSAEQILNWRIERVNGRNVPTRIVLSETIVVENPDDAFDLKVQEQIRVLKLVSGGGDLSSSDKRPYHFEVEIWKPKETRKRTTKTEWELAETKVPLRLGKPLPLIPFVFHGPRHSRADVDRPPLRDIIAVNLDHYRLNADYKHGLHYTALPTAWVSGFEKDSTLVIGSRAVWFSETPGAAAGYLEFTGQGLTTFERAMDRDERLMAVLGSRLLEDQKKVGETAQAIQLRQSGENSVLNAIATSVSDSLTQILRWVYWWNSTEEIPDAISSADVLIQLNSDFSLQGMSGQDLQAIVGAWQSGALSQDTMFELFRRGEILPDGRSNDDEAALVAKAVTGAGPLATAMSAQSPSKTGGQPA
jgi:hypothetical protein